MVLVAPRLAAEVQVEAWYHLSDNAFPQDSSGQRRHFRMPMPGYTQASADAAGGPLGPAGYLSMASLEFGRDAISGYWEIGYTPPDDNLGIEVWIKPFGDGWANPGNRQRFGWIFASGSLSGLNLGVEQVNGEMVLTGGVVNQARVGDPTPLEANRWTHLAIVRDRGVTTFYVNGVAHGGTSTAGVRSAGAVHLGVTADGVAGFKGLIDEARIFTFAPGKFQPSDLLLRHREATGTLPLTEDVPLSSYQVKTWQSDSGLPQNTVTAMDQTADGYLWVGTLGGLARFDGGEFKTFRATDTPALGSGRIRWIGRGHDGTTLWITTQEGDLIHYTAGEFTALKLPPGKETRTGFIRAEEDGAGVLWLSTWDGEIARWDGKDYKVVAGGDGDQRLVLRDGAGGPPLAFGKSGVLRADGEGMRAIAPEGLVNPYGGFLCASPANGFWFVNQGHIQHWRDGKMIANAGRPLRTGLKIRHSLEDRSGRVWLATSGSGVLRKDAQGGELFLGSRDGLGCDDAEVIFEDRGGVIWIGTDGGGLSRLNPPLVTTFGVAQSLPAGRVTGLCPGEEDTLWAAIGRGHCQFRGIAPRITAGTGDSLTTVTALLRDGKGRMYAGSSTTGLWIQGTTGFERPAGFPEAAVPVRCLFEDREGRLWVGRSRTQHLMTLDGDKFNAIGLPPAVGIADVCSITQDKDGAIWAGTDGQGLLRWWQGAWQRFTRADGLRSEVIWSLHAEEDGSLWVGTFGGGLSRVKDGKLISCTTRDGLESDTITRIEDDGRGYFWCGSQQGIFRVRKSDLNEFADGQRKQVHCMRYGLADGMPSLECSGGFQPAGCQSSDGRIWFPTLKGVAMVNPSAVRPDPLPPPVELDGMTVDGEFHADKDTLPVFTTGHRRYRFHYAGVDFTAPEALRFRTWLDGVDTGWVDAQRERVADYSQLAPGHYTFRVQARSRDGVWSDPGAAMVFEVRPRWHENPALRVLALLVLLGGAGAIIWAVARAKLRRKLAVIEQQRMLEIERQRIAANIHDDLGASLTRIALLSDLAREGAAAGGVGEEVEQIHDTARELTRTMDEIVWAVDPEHDTLESLAGYLARIAQDLLGPAGIRCRLAIPADLPDLTLSGQVRHNLYLAVKETLHNAIRHAAASEVRLGIEVAAHDFSVVVTDNGKGLGERRAEADRASSGHGKKNLTKRMAEIGGTCGIGAAPGGGTEVRLHVPFAAATRHHQN